MKKKYFMFASIFLIIVFVLNIQCVLASNGPAVETPCPDKYPDEMYLVIKPKTLFIDMYVGQKHDIELSAYPVNSYYYDITKKDLFEIGSLTFNTQNTKVINTTKKGVIKAYKPGKTKVIMNFTHNEGVACQFAPLDIDVNVYELPKNSFIIEKNKKNIKVRKGRNIRLIRSLNNISKLHYSVKNKKIVKLSSKDNKSVVLKGLKRGKTTVVIEYSDKKIRRKITVTKK